MSMCTDEDESIDSEDSLLDRITEAMRPILQKSNRRCSGDVDRETEDLRRDYERQLGV